MGVVRGKSRTRGQVAWRNLEAIGASTFVRRVCVEHGVSLERLLEVRRFKTVCHVRRVVWTVLRHTLDLSFPEIADVFLVDHTVVCAGVHRRERELEELYS